MVKISILTISFLFFLILSCSTESNVEESELLKPKFDSLLAQKLQADDYGMRKYVMAFLKSGSNRNQDSLEVIRLQTAHMENIERMAKEGKLVLAGPFLDDGAIRGIYIFNVETVEEAEKLTETDPAIKAGRLIIELHTWYGSAALMQVNEVHQKIQKVSF